MNETHKPVTQPKDVELTVTPDGLIVKARVESSGWQSAIMLVLFGVWTLIWGTLLAKSVLVQAADGEATVAKIVLYGAAVLLGIYGFALSLWSLFGSEKMRLQGDCLKVGSVWLFGMFPRRFQWSGTQMFTCLDHDCHSDQSSGCACCSSLPKDGYALTFDYRGKRISVFAHASEEAKKWLCGRLNERLLAANGSACSAEEQSCSCTHQ